MKPEDEEARRIADAAGRRIFGDEFSMEVVVEDQARPALLISRGQSLAWLIGGYLVLNGAALITLSVLRPAELWMAAIFAAATAVPYGWGLIALLRRTRLPRLP